MRGTVVFLWFLFPAGLALSQHAPAAFPIPAATEAQAACTGFITTQAMPADTRISDGADNDFESYLHQYAPPDFVYLYSRRNRAFSVGEQFSLVRPAKELFRTTRYSGEHWSLRGLGKPYEDVGRVRVKQVTPEGAIAEVVFACGPVYAGDIALPYRPRAIPEYVPAQLDHFATPSRKMWGFIVAARNNFASMKGGDIVYLNFGEKRGARVGQRYRVYYALPCPSRFSVAAYHVLPPESVGELVVLSTQEKSAVGIIVDSTRDVSLGYVVELE
jgi:hypothetical protein